MSAQVEAVFYVQRPSGTSLWLPLEVLEAIGARRGERLTPAQFETRLVQGMIGARTQAEKQRRNELPL